MDRTTETPSRFNDLPIELRLDIWEATFEPRTVILEFVSGADTSFKPLTPNPSALWINRESREIALKRYRKVFKIATTKAVYFNSDIDSLAVQPPLVYILQRKILACSKLLGYLCRYSPFDAHLIQSLTFFRPEWTETMLSALRYQHTRDISSMFSFGNLREIILVVGDGAGSGGSTKTLGTNEERTRCEMILRDIFLKTGSVVASGETVRPAVPTEVRVPRVVFVSEDGKVLKEEGNEVTLINRGEDETYYPICKSLFRGQTKPAAVLMSRYCATVRIAHLRSHPTTGFTPTRATLTWPLGNERIKSPYASFHSGSQHKKNVLWNSEVPCPLKRISQPPSIRLLELLPGQGLGPIAFNLKEATLSKNLVYEAVSYCWGDPKDVAHIICNGQRLQIPSRLEAALQAMRYSQKSRLLWADAICINQSDNAEKDQQVQLMRTIFSLAQTTLVFLGDMNEKKKQKMSEFALISLRAGLAILRRRVDLRDSPLVSMWNVDENRYRTLAPFTSEFYLELIGMLRLPWFERAWVAQEVTVSSKATIFWGASQYDWDDVIRALKFMAQVNFPLAFVVTLENISAIEEERHFYRNGYSNLHGVLLRHQRCLATDPRDKIYSFSGLIETSSSPKTPVRISYHDEVSTIFKETAINILKYDQSLDLLSRPPTPTISDLDGLPSWAPDWNISLASTLTYSWGHGPLSLAGTELVTPEKRTRFSATGNSRHVQKPLSSAGHLEIEGYEFDKIVEIGPEF
ncbi:hypothetical protein G7Y89_g13186 [Cudoniella acicularis]|uniref:Heterokaryon incompatibility domain-containing protein n=1 Tax=Cudoniella acicularis TaxID=354080 RepID=A0A8H4R7R2_9HELO|nr:hypothetical protein G7Y89_g13186 [Cudoniella acicularis]